MALLVVGVNHKTAPAWLREKVSFSKDALPESLQTLVSDNPSVSEAVILSTCNRTEIYVNAFSVPAGKQDVLDFLCKSAGLSGDDAQQLMDCTYVRQTQGCVKHLFRVVCSLDSLVLGEAQILGQTRTAFQTAQEAGTCATMLNHLFKQALELGKQVRTETSIGTNSVSVSTVAVELALRNIPQDAPYCVLVVGAGEMAQLVATYLAEKGAATVIFANRSLDKAQTLADRFQGKACTLDELSVALGQADVVISSTGSPDFVITKPLIQEAYSHRGQRPLVLMDIALPRDVDPKCSEVPGVTCLNLDDLDQAIDEHKRQREAEAQKAETLVNQQAKAFLTWLHESTATPTIKEIYGKAQGICEREVAHASRELAKTTGQPVTPETQAVLEALANAVSKKILHGPVVRIRKQAANPDAYLYTDTARFLFGLDANPLGLPCRNDPAKCHLLIGTSCGFAENNTCPFGRTIEND